MNTNIIREKLHQEPFRPFSMRLADGREVHISHPEFVAVSPRLVVVIHPTDESVSIWEPLLIVSIETTGGSLPAGNSQGSAEN